VISPERFGPASSGLLQVSKRSHTPPAKIPFAFLIDVGRRAANQMRQLVEKVAGIVVAFLQEVDK
jgi:hypothetical protein